MTDTKPKDESTSTSTGTGNHQVVLPNGDKRIEYIRNQFYGTGELKGNRSGIRLAINKMYEDAGDESGQIPYQIVFSATKDQETDPRIAAAKRKTDATTKKVEKDAAEKQAKDAAQATATAKAGEDTETSKKKK